MQGIKEAIFAKLTASEYFLFIDFKREQLAEVPDCRGSLFSNQELAIASHLDLEVIAFQEDGVKKEDGLLRFLQANCLSFNCRDDLVNRVTKKVTESWKPGWRRELVVERPDPRQHEDVDRVGDIHEKARYWHVNVRNCDYRKPAVNCYGYMESAINLKTNEPVPFETVEYKWCGYLLPNALIAPSGNRKLDAFWVYKARPNEIKFNPFTDWTGCLPRISGPGEYALTYSVVSENFPIARATFRLSLDGTLDDIRFEVLNGR